MEMRGIPFEVTDWASIETSEHPGISGVSTWHTRQYGELRVRLVQYSPGYMADDWCSKGHILLVMEGILETELADGRKFALGPGSSWQVGDNETPHRNHTDTGVKLFIVD